MYTGVTLELLIFKKIFYSDRKEDDSIKSTDQKKIKMKIKLASCIDFWTDRYKVGIGRSQDRD
jgi:hypothetical protein